MTIHRSYCVAAVVTIAAVAFAQPILASENVERFTATTSNIDPEGIALRFDVLNWSDDAAAVIRAIESDDVQQALNNLPTMGYVWPAGSPVGYSVKYAKREATDSGERLTFVTSKPLGSYDFGGWKVHTDVVAEPLDYSVLELNVAASGTGSGTASLAASVIADTQNDSIRLNRDENPPELFIDVQRSAR